jgi:ADP-ribosylglycohydrolase
MIGAIIGDIAGSVYDWHNIKTKYFPLFRDGCFFTDDTVMTVVTTVRSKYCFKERVKKNKKWKYT